MRKVFFGMLTLLAWSVVDVKAQVNIGSLDEPHLSAVLDLSQVPGKNKGLLLSKVNLVALDIFSLEGDEKSAKGLVVYNTNAAIETGIGAYVWNGSHWCKADATTWLLAYGSISFDSSTIHLDEDLTAFFEEVPGATLYLWSFPDCLTAESKVTAVPSIKLTGAELGNFNANEISVIAFNAGGTSAKITGSSETTITVAGD
jgi:hypothetical protein